ncbi:four helix bundle protein [Deferrisoma sp.]
MKDEGPSRNRGGVANRDGDIDTRLKEYALAVVRLVDSLPRTTSAGVLGRQLLRSATSVGAQYREARRARSDAEFVSKLEVGIQELDEAGYWCELLMGGGYGLEGELKRVSEETDELLSILVTIVKRVKARTT